MTTLLNYKATLSYFAYLGFPDKDTTKGLIITKSKKSELRKGKVTRDVFLAYVFGAAGSGKVPKYLNILDNNFEIFYRAAIY